MKLSRNIELVIVAFLYLACLYIWTLPIQKSPLPYGEVDAVSHFTIADYTSQADRPITSLPYFIDRRYGRDNKFMPHTLWYPPPFHMALSIAAVSGGSRIVPIFLLNAVLCSCMVLIIYFVIRKMYGFWPAFLSSLLLMFSLRDINIYLWGQWPERISYALTPLIIYCFYRYHLSFTQGRQKPVYLYIMSGLLAVNLYMHPVGLFHSIAALVVIAIVITVKDKKLPFDIRKLGISILLFLLLASIFPFQTGSVLAIGAQKERQPYALSRLFSWYRPPEGANLGLPLSHFSYRDMHGLWTLPFLFVGIIFLLLRRKKSDLFLIGWLISLYIMLHLDLIGKGRPFRSLSATAHIFYPIMALGAVYLISLISNLVRLPKSLKPLLKYSIILLFILLAISINGKTAYNHLDSAYQGISRINPHQYEAAEWIKDNIKDEKAEIYQIGAISQAKSRWEWMLSNRVIFFRARENATHALIDYSDSLLINDQKTVQQIRAYEENLNYSSKLYDKNNIRVYKLV
ncbi:glycosyltransferase family 39 protein [Candidatus Woesearchaeota archaeon]|nr:glycosyltransferase family 39 protein [Candidatus Woesearchaeota archaeon]